MALLLAGLCGGVASALVGSGSDVFMYLFVVVLFGVRGEAGMVTAVGGDALPAPQPTRQADLYGMWLAAVPIVAWGAPTGAWIASRMSAKALVMLALVVAAAEVISTALFLDALRNDPALGVYSVVGLIVAIGGVMLLATNRQRLFGLPPVDLSTKLTRTSVEASKNYQREL